MSCAISASSSCACAGQRSTRSSTSASCFVFIEIVYHGIRSVEYAPHGRSRFLFQQCQTAGFRFPREAANTTDRSRDASASELCRPPNNDEAHDPGCLPSDPDPRAVSFFARPIMHHEARRRRNAGRRVGNDRAVRARRALIAARSPVGVPPQLLGRRVNPPFDFGTRFLGRGLPVPVQRAPRRPVVMPAGRFRRSPRERGTTPARRRRTRSAVRCVSRSRPSSSEMRTVIVTAPAKSKGCEFQQMNQNVSGRAFFFSAAPLA